MKDFGFDDRIAEAERPNLGSIGGRKKNARTANVANSLKIRRGWINWRWLLLLVFVVGFSLTSPKLSTDWGYLALTIISIASCALLLSRLNVSLDISLPTWTILGVFIIGYYLKFYWIVLDPEILKDMGDVIWQHYSQGSLVPAFRLTTLGFTSFCLSAWAFLRPSRRHRLWKRPELPRAVYRSAAKVLFWLSPILMASTFIFAYRTGILVMGRENVQLPLRLAGVFLYTRTILIPALLLVLIY
jgi:hypothetical protein